jgi:hypothetical protein
MPIEVAHLTFDYIADDDAHWPRYRVLRVINPGERPVVFNPQEITGAPDELYLYGEDIRKDGYIFHNAYFTQGKNGTPIFLDDMDELLHEFGSQSLVSPKNIITTNQVIITSQGEHLSIRYISPASRRITID